MVLFTIKDIFIEINIIKYPINNPNVDNIIEALLLLDHKSFIKDFISKKA